MSVFDMSQQQPDARARVEEAFRQLGREQVTVEVRAGRSWNPLRVKRHGVIVSDMLVGGLSDGDLRALLQYESIRCSAVVWRVIGLICLTSMCILPLAVTDGSPSGWVALLLLGWLTRR